MKRDLGNFAVTMMDQAMLSGLNMLIGLLFIKGASKQEYATYALSFGLVLLLSSVQNAVVNTPLTANGARLTGPGQSEFVDLMYWLQCALAVCAGGVLGTGVWAWLRATGGVGGARLGGGVAIAVMGAWWREFRRTEHYLRLRAVRVFLGDLVYVSLSGCSLVAVYLMWPPLQAWEVLGIVGVIGIGTGVRPAPLPHRSPATTPKLWRDTRELLSGQVRWTLPGVAVTWAQSTAYSYVVAAIAGTSTVADLAAGRLFLTPLAFAVVAWARLFMPKAGAMLARRDDAAVWQLASRGVKELLGAAGLYLLALAGFFLAGGKHWVPAKYAGVLPLVGVWSVYFVMTILRGVGSTALLAHTAFRSVFVFSLWAAIFSLPLMVGLTYTTGAAGTILAMLAGEAVLGLLVWRELSRYPRASRTV